MFLDTCKASNCVDRSVPWNYLLMNAVVGVNKSRLELRMVLEASYLKRLSTKGRNYSNFKPDRWTKIPGRNKRLWRDIGCDYEKFDSQFSASFFEFTHTERYILRVNISPSTYKPYFQQLRFPLFRDGTAQLFSLCDGWRSKSNW